MTDEMAPICRQVWERAFEGGDVMADAGLAAHVGSCVTCFRTLAELRDAPRLAAALCADAPAVPVSERFWDDLAARTSAAAASALAPGASKRRYRLRATGISTTLAAAAAALVLVFSGRGPVAPPVGGSAAAPRAAAPGVAYDDEGAVDGVDVADLDESALRRLLDRLRASAPAHVAAIAAAGDAQDGSDPALDDEGVSDQLAEMDGPALLRLERSLGGAPL
jgi:hypothetical protein